jgi:hypothetical protein
MKGILKSTMVLEVTMLILITSGALYSDGIVSAHVVSAASHFTSYTSSTTPHALAIRLARPGERSSTGTGGQLLWRYQIGSDVTSSSAVVNGVVYVGSNDDYV